LATSGTLAVLHLRGEKPSLITDILREIARSLELIANQDRKRYS